MGGCAWSAGVIGSAVVRTRTAYVPRLSVKWIGYTLSEGRVEVTCEGGKVNRMIQRRELDEVSEEGDELFGEYDYSAKRKGKIFT